MLRQENKDLKLINETQQRTIKRVADERDKALIERDEARRRTIPVGRNGDGGEINFLPTYVETVEVQHPSITVHSISGTETVVAGTARAKIYARGDVVYSAPVKK